MKKLSLLLLAAFSTLGQWAPAEAPRESYIARLSERDHRNSSGARLTSAAAVIRQDRANYHKFNRRDDEDESDRFFSYANNRDRLEKLLERGTADGGVLRRITSGTPLIRVDIYEEYVRVSLLD